MEDLINNDRKKTKKLIQIIVDDNPQLNYEKANWKYYLFVLPFCLILSIWVAFKKLIFRKRLKINTFWFDGASLACRLVKENATNWRALDIIYNYVPKKDNSFESKITNFWNELRNIKALRNRFKLVKYKLKENIKELSQTFSEIRLISVASGSAQPVIEVMKEMKDEGIIVKAIFLDLDQTAIEHSIKLAQEAGIKNQINFVNESARNLEIVANGFNPHIVEVVGFLEYRPKQRAIDLIKRIYNLLVNQGVLITSTVSPSLEVPFIHYVSDWPEIYRNVDQFIDILVGGGFNPEKIQIIYEPLKIQKVAVCKK